MTSVRDHAAAYLAMRRNLGYKLHKHGRLLMEFTGYLDDHGHRTITIDAATAWATAPASSTPTGASGYRRRGVSPATCRPSTRPARSRHRVCSDPQPAARHRFCIRHRRSLRSSTRRARWPIRCKPPRIRH